MTGWRRELAGVTVALLIALAVGSLMVIALHQSPLRVWSAMGSRTISDPYALGQLVFKATSLCLTGLAVAVALEAGMFNLGAEGQLQAAVVGVAAIGGALASGTPAIVAVPLCVVAAAVIGGACGWLIGVLRERRGAHEVITSIALNAVIAAIALWLGNRYLFVAGATHTAPIVDGATLPLLGWAGSAANVSIVLTIAVVAGMLWLRDRTAWGLAWRMVGQGADAAEAAGIAVRRTRTLVMALSGGLAGLAAVNLVLGYKHTYEQGLGSGIGIWGIAVALLGRRHPLGVAAASLFIAALSVGGLAIGDLVPKEIVEVLQGVVVLAIAGAAAWTRRGGPTGASV